MAIFSAFLEDDSGEVSLEYGVIGAGLSILVVAAASQIGLSLNTLLAPLSAAFGR